MIGGNFVNTNTFFEMFKCLFTYLDRSPVFPRAISATEMQRVRLRTGRKIALMRKILAVHKGKLIH
jgi:hypothetical protein